MPLRAGGLRFRAVGCFGSGQGQAAGDVPCVHGLHAEEVGFAVYQATGILHAAGRVGVAGAARAAGTRHGQFVERQAIGVNSGGAQGVNDLNRISRGGTVSHAVLVCPACVAAAGSTALGVVSNGSQANAPFVHDAGHGLGPIDVFIDVGF